MDIKQLRVNALKRLIGDSQLKDFAEKHDLDASYLSQILNGHRGMGEKAAANMAAKIGVDRRVLVNPEDAIEGEFERIIEPLELPAFLRREDIAPSNVQGGPVAIKDGVVPVVGMAKLGAHGYFDAIDYPVGHGDGYVLISSSDENAYALRVVGDSMEPRIRNGEYVMIEPNRPYVSGDDVLVQFTDGTVTQSMIKVFMHERDGFVRLLSVNDAHAPMTIERERILKIHPVGAILKPSRYISAG